MPPKPAPNEEPTVDAPSWTPDVREPDPDLLPDELPVPNPDENRQPPKRALRREIMTAQAVVECGPRLS
nr:hypothetical protein [Mesorhizobium carmichaelinearum]